MISRTFTVIRCLNVFAQFKGDDWLASTIQQTLDFQLKGLKTSRSV